MGNETVWSRAIGQRGQRRGWRVMAVVAGMAALGLVLFHAPARAQSAPAARAQPDDVVESLEPEDRPWAEGVPEARQERAREVFAEANQAMKDGLFARAAARYRDTLQLWDHPGAHYNLGLAQLSLDQPIEAYDSFGNALRFGPSPLLGQEKYEQAQRYREVLAKQLARIEVACGEHGAAVTLDGRPLFTGPGRYEGMVRPGGHQLVASKPGHIPATEQAVLSPGEHKRYELGLVLADSVETRRRWAAWKPWAVVGAGAVVALGAGYFDRRSSQSFDGFDSEFDGLCNMGCPETEVPAQLRDRLEAASRDQQVARITYAVGGAVLVTGAVLVYVNRERIVRRRGRERAAGVAPLPRIISGISPSIGPGRAGIRMELRF